MKIIFQKKKKLNVTKLKTNQRWTLQTEKQNEKPEKNQFSVFRFLFIEHWNQTEKCRF